MGHFLILVSIHTLTILLLGIQYDTCASFPTTNEGKLFNILHVENIQRWYQWYFSLLQSFLRRFYSVSSKRFTNKFSYYPYYLQFELVFQRSTGWNFVNLADSNH